MGHDMLGNIYNLKAEVQENDTKPHGDKVLYKKKEKKD